MSNMTVRTFADLVRVDEAGTIKIKKSLKFGMV
jgi:hypothetical protein